MSNMCIEIYNNMYIYITSRLTKSVFVLLFFIVMSNIEILCFRVVSMYLFILQTVLRTHTECNILDSKYTVSTFLHAIQESKTEKKVLFLLCSNISKRKLLIGNH
uniref:Uncharacterized protein n=1 Tax=Micrurus carvalhoi TaxID=3147026 RepID=A0A2H6N6N4_9SAUR